jgi:hypothetical protein
MTRWLSKNYPLLSALLLFLLIPCSAKADFSVTLRLDRKEATLMDSIRMVINVSGSRKSDSVPTLHNMESFNVSRGGTSSRIEIINGKLAAAIDYKYFIQPKKIGTFKVGPAEVMIEGKAFRSNTETVNIVKPSQSSGANRGPLFLNASISKEKPYVEEQVIYTLKLYRMAKVSDISLDLPETEHLTFRQLGKPVEYKGLYNGQSYQILEVRYALIPSREGTYGIRPARMHMTVYQPETRSQRDRFDDPFFNAPFFSMSSGRPMTLDSEPLELKVLPLPEKGRPTEFSGLVGSFRIRSSITPSEVKAGESATLTVSLSGKGNVKRIPDLKMPELDQIKVYADQPMLKEETDLKGVGGSKIMKWALVPEKEGKYQIPPISVSFFDTKSHEYRTTKSLPLLLSVLPGAKEQVQPPAVHAMKGEPSASGKKAIKELGHDILPVHTSIKDFADRSGVWAGGMVFWMVLCAPLFVYVATFWGLRSARKSVRSIAVYKAKRAPKTLIQQCRGRGVSASKLALYIRDYLNDRFGLSLGSLTPKEAAEVLESKGISVETAGKLQNIVQELEDAIYTGKGNETWDMNEDIPKLIKQIEKGFL